jgi:hypothetical protein
MVRSRAAGQACVPHVAVEACLAYRAAHALYEGRVLEEAESPGVGSSAGEAKRNSRF